MFSLPSFRQGNTSIKTVQNSVTKSDSHRSFSCAFVSCDMPYSLVKKIEERGHTVRRLPPFSAIDRPVSSHPDMLILPLDDKIVIPGQYYNENAELFTGFNVLPAEEDFSPKYPHDIALNALETDCGIFCRESNASARIRESAKKIINVAQGYARCSCCRVNGHAIITADPSIAVAAKDEGIEVLEICSADIALPGYNYGFIGGSSAVTDNEVLFFGDINTHPDSNSIKEFIYSHSKTPISLSDTALTDYGGIVFI